MNSKEKKTLKTFVPITSMNSASVVVNYSRPGRVWSVASRMGTGKSITFFYSVKDLAILEVS